MNIVASIEARMGSSRYINKMIENINGKTTLERVITRLKKSNLINKIILATTKNPNDDLLEEIARKNFIEVYRGSEYTIDFLPKIQLEIVMDDSQVTEALDVIKATAKTTKIGDGKIFVLPVEQAIRIRTDESGIDAL